MPTILIIVLVVLVLLVFYFIATRNNLVRARNRVKEEFSQIDVALKRRFDLIPNLVETVKGYAKHEKETLEAVIAARNTYLSAGTSEDAMKANDTLTQGLSKLFALAESYPELKANTNFQELQTELSKTEDIIANSRTSYNTAVTSYNNLVEMFPSSIVASMSHFEKEKFFEATQEETKNPEVKF